LLFENIYRILSIAFYQVIKPIMKTFPNSASAIYLLVLFSLCLHSSAAIAAKKSTQKKVLTFANTQTWRPDYLNMAETGVDIPEIKLPAPPSNDSDSTKRELALLHSYQKVRTKKEVAEIKGEIDVPEFHFGQSTLKQLVYRNDRLETLALMNEIVDFEAQQVMRQKKIHNRVRPSYLDPTLKPVINVPQHPAYPSGHATQAYLRALILSELDPANRSIYMQSAYRIARNREIAGLHYPSDSKAGALFAQQLFAKLKKDPSFAERLKAAKAEW
jgi:PAP2 superfamily